MLNSEQSTFFHNQLNMKPLPNTITIFSVCDNHFSVLLGALIKSVEINHLSEEHINFYIVGDNLSRANKENLVNCATSEKISFFLIDISDVIKDKSKLPIDGSSFPLIVYIRLFFPLFIPADVKKVIYLDADMIVQKDVSVLWKIDLEDKTVAGVPDRSQIVSSPWGGIPNFEELNIDSETKYFNSGLLIINRNKWVETNSTEKIIDCIARNKKFASFPDQYGLNVLFANQWFELDHRWNSYSPVWIEDPFIIHFIGIKPIFTNYKYSQKFKDVFFSYLRLTPWANYKPRRNYVRLIIKLRNRIFKKGYSFIAATKKLRAN